MNQVDKVSAAIREDICSRPVPQAMRELTVSAYESLMSRFDAPVPVAVRSSATAEDLPDASFAGQQDTYLWLDGVKAVTEHIRQCWASLFTSRAIIYRLKNNIPNEGLSMAVVVQKMVNARVSGVAITMDPTNGDRSKITIDSSYGVGEMVVSGQVTPDNIMLDKVTLAVVTEHLGDKHAELVPDAGASRLVEREVDAERRGRRSLTDAELTAVAQMAKRAEKHYKCPQDIEWALDADLPDGENLLLLQSRPETVHSSKPCLRRPPRSRSVTGGYFSGFSAATAANRLRLNRLAQALSVPCPPTQAQRRARIERTAMSLKSFPKPSELAVPAGAEGWEKIYPYYLVFQDKLKEQEDAKFWFCDSQHWPTVFKPFETIGGEFAVKCLGQYNARHLMIPNANGIEFRVHLGYLYMSPIPVPEDQIAARVPLFEQRVGHYFQNWDQLLKQWHVKVKGTIDEMETISFPKLPDVVPHGGHPLRQGQGRLREAAGELRPTDPAGLPELAVPLRVPQPRLHRLPGLLQLLQAGLPQHPGPVHRHHGAGRRHGTLPPG